MWKSTCIVLVCAWLWQTSGTASEWWIGPGEPGVVTHSDCGYISAVSGQAVIRRSFMTDEDAGLPAFVADRLHAGDEISVAEGGSLEITSGTNSLVVISGGTKTRLQGVRSIKSIDGIFSRLDVTLITGEVRVQVRLNQEQPEGVMIRMDPAEVVVTRGDAAVKTGESWFVTSLAGPVLVRNRRGAVVGAPYVLDTFAMAGAMASVRVDEDMADGLRLAMPFSYETTKAALPPRPALGEFLEAP